MKTINTLALAAFALTLSAYLFTMDTPSAPAEAQGANLELDLLPARHQAAPAKPNPAAALAPSPVLEAKPGPNPVLEALRNNDVCGMNALKKDAYAFDANDAAALLETSGASAELAEFLGPDGALLGTKAKKFKYPGSKLVWALRLAGLYDRSTVALPGDLKTAHKLLLELEKTEPSNGAYPFFRLIVEDRLHRSAEELTRTAEAVAAASRFDTHVDELGGEITRMKWLSPGHFILFRAIAYYLEPRPYLHEGVVLLKSERLHLPANIKESIGQRMLEKGAAARSPYYSGEYNTDQYEEGRQLMGDEPIESIWEISRKYETQRDAGEPTAPGLFTTRDGSPVCDSRAFEEFYYANIGKQFY